MLTRLHTTIIWTILIIQTDIIIVWTTGENQFVYSLFISLLF